MGKIVTEFPVGVTTEFSSGNFANSDVGAFSSVYGLFVFTPCYAELGSKLGDVFIIFAIRPKLDFDTGFFL